MGVIHFLNVKDGDCIWIQHPTGHNTIIDVCNAKKLDETQLLKEAFLLGNFHQKNHPVNPIQYFKDFNMSYIFRFILTHPDMDHMDGIKALFESYDVINFWDTENDKTMDENSTWGQYNKNDWDYYQEIRKKDANPKVLHVYANAQNKFFNKDESGKLGGDGLYILAPTPELVEGANTSKDYNDCSYVILYRMGNKKKIIFAGDSAEKTWDYILENHKADVSDIDLLIAPHHGRKTGGNYDYLDTLKPKLTLFGNAKSEYLDYASWNNRGLDHITNNQANCVVIVPDNVGELDVYVTNETFAKKRYPNTFKNNSYNAWYITTI